MEPKNWFVIQSKPQKETVVCAQLERVREKVEYFFPKIRNHLGVRPLFPSYVFVKADVEDIESYRLIKYTRGVLRFVGSREGAPYGVEAEVVSTIRSRLGTDGLIDQRQVFDMGRAVKIKRGPLKDLIGILEKPSPEEGRVQVLFRLLKYPLRAVLKFEDLVVL